MKMPIMKISVAFGLCLFFSINNSKAQTTVYLEHDAAGNRTKRTTIEPPPDPCEGCGRYSMTVSPSPAKEYTTLVIDEKLKGENMKVQLISADGKVIRDFNTTSTQHEINVANLAVGMYFIHVTTGKANMQYTFGKVN